MLAGSKSQWRARLRAARLARDDAGRLTAAAQLAPVGRAWVDEVAPRGDICAYLASGGEPSLELLLPSLVSAGRRVLVPVCEPDFRLSWVPWRPGIALFRSAFAPVWEPVGPRLAVAELSPGALLLPALAADTSGVRLGQGGGYYDRFLATLTGAAADVSVAAWPTAAVVYAEELLPPGLLPQEPWDQRVTRVLTPLAAAP